MRGLKNNGLYFILFLLTTSCLSLEKAVEKVTETEQAADFTQRAIHVKYPTVTAKMAATEYPTLPSEVIQGEEQTQTAEQEQPGPVVPCADEKGTPVKQVQCPPVRVVTVTKTRVDTLRLRDTGAEQHLLNQLKAAQNGLAERDATIARQEKEQAETKKERNHAYWFGGIVLLVLSAFFYFLVIRAR